MLDLYFWPTPNTLKVTIQLEECGLDYRVRYCDITKGEQFAQAFVELHPGSQVPVLVDHSPAEGQAPLTVFESGAIMLYLAEKTTQFMPRDLHGRYNVIQWVVWQMANQGPRNGEANHFRRLEDSQGDQSYAVNRFTNIANRLYGVLNNHLYDRRYLCGDEYTIADMICYPWTVKLAAQGQDINDFKYFKRWFEELSARPAVQTGMRVGREKTLAIASLPKEEIAKLSAFLSNQRARPAPDTGGLEA